MSVLDDLRKKYGLSGQSRTPTYDKTNRLKEHEAFFNSLREKYKVAPPQEDPNKLRVVQADPPTISGVISAPDRGPLSVVQASPTSRILPPKPQVSDPIQPRGPAKPMPVVGANGTLAPFPPAPKVGIKEFAKEVPGSLKKVGNFLLDIPRTAARSGVSVGATASEIYGGRNKYVPDNKIDRFLLGSEPIESLSTRAIKNAPVAKEYLGKVGVENKAASYGLSTATVLGLTALDFTGFGGESKNAIKVLTKLGKIDGVARVMKEIGVADDLIKEYAPIIAKTSKEAEVSKIVAHIDDIQKSTTKVAPTVAEEAGKIANTDRLAEPSRRTLTGLSQAESPSLLERPKYTSQAEELGTTPRLTSRTTGQGGYEIPIRQTESSLSYIDNTADDIVEQSTKRVNDYIRENQAALKGLDNLEAGGSDVAKAGLYQRAKTVLDNAILKTREVFEDSWIRGKKIVERLEKQTGGEVVDSANFYQKQILMPGRVQSRIDDLTARFRKIDQDTIQRAKQLKIPEAELGADVQDFLIASHAVERNKAVGESLAAGISDGQAQQILKRVNDSPYAAEVKAIAAEYRKISDETLDILYDGQLIKKETYDTLKSQYKNHVPLQRMFDEIEDFNQVLTAKGNSVKDSGLLKAKGSTRQIADIRDNLFANLNQAIKQTERNRVNLSVLEFARENKHLGLFEEVPFYGARKTDPSLLFMFENGKHKVLKINDPQLATMLRGLNQQQLPAFFSAVRAYTRLYSSLATRFNPEFILSNKLRDLQEMVVFMSSQKELGAKSALKAAAPDGKNIKAVWEYLQGADTEGARLYRQMKLDGGTTGGMGLSTRSQVEATLKDVYKANRSVTKKQTQKLMQAIDNLNTIFEDSTRLAVYKESLAKGLSREKAASLAKEATINFNKMGTAGPVVNALWMFSNASIQGSAKMLRALKNPKVLGTVATTVTAASWTVNKWNDSVDPDWREKANKWDRTSNLVIALPSSDGIKYITIPISWGIKPLKVMADYGYELMNDKTSPWEAAKGTMTALIDAYNPAGGTDLGSALVPTIGDLPVDIWRNRAWHGGPIRPDSDPNAAESTKYFKSQNDTFVGRKTKQLTDWAYDKYHIDISPANVKYAYEQLVGGAGRAASRVVNTISSIGSGEVPKASETPFVNRFFKSKSEDELDSGVLPKKKFYEINEQVRKEQSVQDKKVKEAVDYMMGGTEKDKAKLRKMQADGLLTPEFLKEMSDEFDARSKGLTSFETSFKKAPVEARGKYLYEITKDKTPDEKKEIINYLISKNLLTDKIVESLIKEAANAK